MTTGNTTATRRKPGHAPGESRIETLQRMLLKARAEGVKIYRLVGEPGAYTALSTGKRGAYIVRPGDRANGCTCEGYRQHEYCKHYAAALCVERMLTSPQPDPTTPAPAAALRDLQRPALTAQARVQRHVPAAPLHACKYCGEIGRWVGDRCNTCTIAYWAARAAERDECPSCYRQAELTSAGVCAHCEDQFLEDAYEFQRDAVAALDADYMTAA